MFGTKEIKVVDDKKVKELEREIGDLKHSHRLELEKKDHENALKIKDLEFEMKNFKDSEILARDKEIIRLTNENAVFKKESEMMKEMVDINADIIDVKEIINKLIEKLPEVNLTSLTVNAKGK